MALGDTNDLRLELRTRNNVLWHLIFDSHPTVADFCRHYDLEQTTVGGFLNLKLSPYTKRGPSVSAVRLAEIARCCVEDLFPPDLYSGTIPRQMVAEIPARAYRPLAAAQHLALPAAQEQEVVQRELKEALATVLHTLTPREERVIRARFGLDGEEESLREIGERYSVTTETVRKIEQKALNVLRKPSRGRVLRPYLEAVR